MQFAERKGPVADMNVVPLIDILLVLLIIFMVITPTVSKGLQAQVPQPATEYSPSPSPIVVQVVSGGNLKINQEDATSEDLGPRLRSIFKGRADKIAFIRGDNGVPFAEVARAIDIMRGADVEKVGLITSQLEPGQ